jgi:hypothetical protein
MNTPYTNDELNTKKFTQDNKYITLHKSLVKNSDTFKIDIPPDECLFEKKDIKFFKNYPLKINTSLSLYNNYFLEFSF